MARYTKTDKLWEISFFGNFQNACPQKGLTDFWPVNLGMLVVIYIMGEVDFDTFENACPRRCSGDFGKNFTELKYPEMLQTGRVISASVLISSPLAMTCECSWCTSVLKKALLGIFAGFHITKQSPETA